jgi:hypothetical protein
MVEIQLLPNNTPGSSGAIRLGSPNQQWALAFGNQAIGNQWIANVATGQSLGVRYQDIQSNNNQTLIPIYQTINSPYSELMPVFDTWFIGPDSIGGNTIQLNCGYQEVVIQVPSSKIDQSGAILQISPRK